MCYSALVKKDLTFLGKEYGATEVRDQITNFEHLSAENPKKYPPLKTRIFPGNYAPVIYREEDKNLIRLMRYGAYPPPDIRHPGKYTTYNARKDNLLSPFWRDAYLQHHGFVVLLGMYEWVLVKDLLKAGVVSMDAIRAYFEHQTVRRKAKILSEGKKYKPTPIELTDPLERRIIIEFKPENAALLLVPVIYSAYPSANGIDGWGFAIVTDEPTPEVQRAGHDRSPVILSQAATDAWLSPQHHTSQTMSRVLENKVPVVFSHKLASSDSFASSDS